MDMESFTEDILARLKQHIETATVVIADITGNNPNVYLEIGYDWGKGVPTILLANKNQEEEIKFNPRGQKGIEYQSIKGLRELLGDEMTQLKSTHFTYV